MYRYIYVKLILVEVLLQLATQTSGILVWWLEDRCGEQQAAVWLPAGTASSEPPPRPKAVLLMMLSSGFINS